MSECKDIKDCKQPEPRHCLLDGCKMIDKEKEKPDFDQWVVEHIDSQFKKGIQPRDHLGEEAHYSDSSFHAVCDRIWDEVVKRDEEIKALKEENEELILYKHACNESIAHLHRENESLKEKINILTGKWTDV